MPRLQNQPQQIKAIEDYKAAKERPFPSWTEVLQIVKAIGYRKVAESKPVAKAKSSPEKRKSAFDFSADEADEPRLQRGEAHHALRRGRLAARGGRVIEGFRQARGAPAVGRARAPPRR